MAGTERHGGERKHRRARSGAWPYVWAGASAVGYVLAVAAGAPDVWSGVLLAFPIAITASGLGWRPALPLLPIGVLLAYAVHAVSGANEPATTYVALIPLLLLGVAGGDSIYRLWRASERRARANATRANLLSTAVMTLQDSTTDEQIFRAVPPLLANLVSFAHADVFVPRGERMKLAATYRWDIDPEFDVTVVSITGRAYRTGEWQYVPDVTLDPEYVIAPNAGTMRSELAIPIRSAGTIVAVVNLEHERADAYRGDLETLRAFAAIVEAALRRTHDLRTLERRAHERELTTNLVHRLLQLGDTKQIAEHALEVLALAVPNDHAHVFELADGRFQPIASIGRVPPPSQALLEAGLPWRRGLIYRAWSRRDAVYADAYAASDEYERAYASHGVHSVAYLPILRTDGEPQAVLGLFHHDTQHAWTAEERSLLGSVADSVGLALERAVVTSQLREMLEAVRSLAQTTNPTLLYQRAVEASVRLVRDAEAASLLVLFPEGFRFVGAVGFTLEDLSKVPPMSMSDQLAWYGGTEEAFRRGVPRVIRRTGIGERSREAMGANAGQEHLRDSGRVDDIQSNISVPITVQGEVLGVLNLDAFSRDDAFSDGALRLAEAYAQQIGVIIRQAHYRDALERTVVTDPLTGLGNRAGFNRRLASELASAQRHGYPLSVVVMDLDGFKTINDSFGHPAGDEALERVARALEGERRGGDTLFRWGGDEFVLLLPRADAHGARGAAQRYAAAVARVTVRGLALEASVGIASFPEDGATSEALLKRADDLMYEHKVRA